jgi:DNA replication protein DnaC
MNENIFLNAGWHERSLKAERNFLQKDVARNVNDFLQRYWKGENIRGLYIQGKPSAGKTMLSSLIAQWIYKEKKIIPYFRTAYELRSESLNDEGFRALLKYPLLFIDDFGIETGTAFSQFTQYQIIDTRLTRYLPTFFTSNVNVDNLEKRLQWRIREMCSILTI